jgi:hypothetical protein
MKRHLITIQEYLDVAEVFRWGYMSHYVRWFTGKSARHQRTERVLKRLVKNGKFKSFLYGSRLIYELAKRERGIDTTLAHHGLACTECLVRFYGSKPDGTAIPEKYFRGFGSVPEWGIIYPDGKLLLFEFCTKSNFLYSGNMRGKLGAYRQNLHKIEEKFNAKAMVIFVLEVDRGVVERWVGSVGGVPPLSNGDTFPDPFFFTDYETFLKVPFGQAIEAPIYFWVDGKEYSLNGH